MDGGRSLAVRGTLSNDTITLPPSNPTGEITVKAAGPTTT